MILNFQVQIEVDYRGEENIPYIKHLLSGRVAHCGIPKVWCEGQDKVQSWAEEIEKDAHDRGVLPL